MAFAASVTRCALRRVTTLHSVGVHRLLRSARTAVVTAPRRTFASGAERESLVIVDKDADRGTALLQLNRPPVNSLSLELLSDIRDAIQDLEDDPAIRGFVLASTGSSVFSAGLDITEMYQPDNERLASFWAALQDVWLALYGTGMATVAAVDGHAPAGGCLLALCCDERVMAEGFTDNFVIGLNETQLGIVAPFWFKDTMVDVVGVRETSRLLQLGLLVPSDEAKAIGLVDSLQPHGTGDVLLTAQKALGEYVAVHDAARRQSKLCLREANLQKLRDVKQQDIDDFVAFCNTDAVQRSIGAYLASLAKRKKKN